MRNYKLRISALIPSKWFHKLKNMNKPNTKNPLTSYSFNTTKKSLPHSSSSSFYFSKRSHTSLESKILQISPRNSLHMMKQSKRKTVYKPSPPPPLPSSSSVSTSFIKSLRNHDSSSASNRTKETVKTHHLYVKVNKQEEEEDSCRCQKKHKQTLVSNGRRSSSSASSPRMKLRVNSPRIQVTTRRSKSRSPKRQVLENFAVIKNSVDPKKDFRESMVEMIEENNIRASKDLVDLLVCYLSLNHKKYHDLIIKVFVQVWLEVITSTFA